MLILKHNFSFCASHRLFNPTFSDDKNKEIYGKCAGKNGHGHNYKLEVAITGQVDPETSMLFNLQDLSDIVYENIINDVDHKHLNFDVLWLEGKIPTIEIFIEEIWKRLDKSIVSKQKNKLELYSVTLWETETNFATRLRN
ncbi:6-pyruvoyl trahydropterin synthase family protein [Fluviispira sanaruensis]|uniref:6-carboxy-5,6,7,8-tetrahydropterin synthase n=1 Tax=Fluviispira sanaruensis TaxID=2493639 RepID=A0A4V0P2K1_FLUSA|nr:6-carboxytetrahydropterin synthase [Fluviispira sanaruensis]BBH53507.1 6-carboxytetrahydropterin synthase [Fluviispira sanaruensis]